MKVEGGRRNDERAVAAAVGGVLQAVCGLLPGSLGICGAVARCL